MAERAIASQRSLASQASSGNLTPRFVEPEAVISRMNEVYDAIARRAFELFEGDGRVDGRELDHWFKAEAEILHPARVQIRESNDAVTVDAEVPGFSVNELQVSLEPRRLTITGTKHSKSQGQNENIVYSELCSRELLRSIELPAEVNVERATATLNNGVLELNVAKAAAAKSVPLQTKSAGAA